MINEAVKDRLSYPSRFVDVYGSKIHYLEAGEGDPILLLHGIPTSSYLWRNIFPHLTSLGRCIAPDLIGFGKSDKPDITYSVFDHIKYIEKFIEVLNLKKITLIMHGWGSVVGCSYAMHHEKNCKGLVFYEAFLRSMNGNDLSLPLQEQLATLRNIESIADITAHGANFVDKLISQNILRHLTEEEIKQYHDPFTQTGSSKPLLQYFKDLPKGEGDSNVDTLIADYSAKLTQSTLPKLLLYSVPGFITTIATVSWAKEHLSKLEIIEVQEELHFTQHSDPNVIGKTISIWLQGIEAEKGE